MRKNILTLLLCVMATSAMAIPAKPGLWRTLKTVSGIEVRAQLAGDEHAHYWVTEDGTRYVPTTGEDDLFAPADEAALARQVLRRRAPLRKQSQRLAGPRKVETGERTHYEGQKKGIVILVEFTDVKFKTANNLEKYNRVLNEEGYSEGSFRGSVADYFKAQSAGQFELNFDVVGPYTLKKNQKYYGQNDSQGNDMHPDEMVVEACTAANAEVNFADYDWDDDGEVDQVFVVYAGRGEADGGGKNTVWPHMYYLSATNNSIRLDGVRIDTYACSNEVNASNKIDGIGTFCHEFSHCLGFPDFYDTSYSGWFGMGEFDLMCSGSYNGDGFCPPNYTAHEKMMCGWREPTVLAKKDTIISNLQSMSNNGETFIIYNEAHPDEYYMIENRQKTGWDASYPGRGLMITHVDFDKDIWFYNVPNTKITANSDEHKFYGYPVNDHQRMTLFRANNSTSTYNTANSLYPYSKNDSLTATSKPAASLYNANAEGKKFMKGAILNIKQNADGTMGFEYRSGYEQSGGDDVGPDDDEPGEDQLQLFYESFDQCAGTGGNDGLWSGNIASATFQPDNKGWGTLTENNANFGGNQCARFGKTSVVGYAVMPAIKMRGAAIMTFKAGAWAAANESTTLQIQTANDSEGTFDIIPSELEIAKGAWTDCSVTIRPHQGSENSSVRLVLSTGKRFFLDEVRVVREDIITSVNPSSITRRPSSIYTIDGRYVGTDKNALGHGLYIVDGKKFIK